MLGAMLFPNSLIKKNKDIFGHLSIYIHIRYEII